MSFSSVTGAIYADAAGQSILAQVALPGRASPAPYRAVNGDATSQAFFTDLVAGVYGTVAAYVAPSASIPELRAYANSKAQRLLGGVRSYALTGGLAVLADATTATGVDLQSLTVWGNANPSATTNWVDNDGGVVTLTGAQCVALAQAVLAYAQSVYAVLAIAMNGISNATIATTAALDALAWPA